MSSSKKKKLDPLYQLFEHFLFNRSYNDAAAFAKEVAEEYLTYLDSTPAHVPFHTRMSLLKDLETEAHEMLVKRMYGCVKSIEHKEFGNVVSLSEKLELTEHEWTPSKPDPVSKED